MGSRPLNCITKEAELAAETVKLQVAVAQAGLTVLPRQFPASVTLLGGLFTWVECKSTVATCCSAAW